MKVLLALPKFEGAYFVNYIEPLNLGYLAAYLSKNYEHRVSIGIQTRDISERDFLSLFEFDVLGLSVYTANLKAAKALTKLAKTAGKKIIWGGPLPTGMPEIIRDAEADYAVIGEGEETLAELISYIAHGKPELSSINGIAYIEENEVRQNNFRNFIEDLDSLPFPRRDFIPNVKPFLLEASFIFEVYKPQVIPLVFSRGCVYSCPYCLSLTQWRRRCRARSAENLLEELTLLALNLKQKVKYLSFLDADINGAPTNSERLYQRLIGRGFEWFCETSPVYLSYERLDLMREAGCRGIFLGIESGALETQQWINKGLYSAQDIKKTLSMVKYMEDIGIKCIAAFLIGLPPDNKNTLAENRKFLRKLEASFCWFSYPHPYPGTQLYQLALQKRWIGHDYSLELLGNTVSPTLPTESLSKSMLKRHFWITVLSFFTSRRFLIRLLKNFMRSPKSVLIFFLTCFIVIKFTMFGIINRFKARVIINK